MKKKLFSVFTKDLEHCIETGLTPAHVHHIFYGKNRKNAEEDGYVIPLYGRLHNMSNEGIHFNHEYDMLWKRKAQRHYEQTHTREEFIERYGRSYL